MDRRLTLVLFLLFAAGAWSQDAPPPAQDPPERRKPVHALADLSIEELMQIEVTSVSRKEQSLFYAPAAVTVVRNEDARRTGVTSLPEALRAVPGMDVGKINSNTWAVSARGFNGRFANKLQVLVDGRSVYSPLFSGVFWYAQDVMMQDLDRIEVIRGPGGATWGANAVNGVVNVMTRSAKDTQGWLVHAGGGTEERAFAAARYGAQIGEDAYLRVYAKYFDRDDSGRNGHDDWAQGRAGFRSDWMPTTEDTITIQGDYYDGYAREVNREIRLTFPAGVNTFYDRTDLAGGNLIARWDRRLSTSSNLKVQLAYDRTSRKLEEVEERVDTLDVDAQLRVSPLESHDIVAGVGYRFVTDEIENTSRIIFTPDSETNDVVSVFLQDDITLVRERLNVVLGARAEHNDYSLLEVQPTVRAIWTPADHLAFWASGSRAVRVPSRVDEGLRVNLFAAPTGPPPAPPVLGSFFFDDGRPERLIALELGQRVRPSDSLSIETAAFYNIYSDLQSSSNGAPFPEADPPPNHTVIPVYRGNEMDGVTYGVEVSLTWKVIEGWTLSGYYAWLETRLDALDPAHEGSESAERENARNKAYVRSSFDLPRDLQLDLVGRYVDALGSLDVPSYIEADVRIGWKATKNFEISVVGQNLLHKRHKEFKDYFEPEDPIPVDRGVYVALTGRF